MPLQDSVLDIATPRVLSPLLQPATYKGAWGGRMGMKSHFYAELAIERCIEKETRIVCIREVQKSIKQSVKLLLEDKLKAMGVSELFEVTEMEIRHKTNGSFIIFQGMQNHTADSIKSLENFDVAWWEEAQTASEKSLNLLIPTIIRKPDAELWFSWNPDTEDQPIEKLLRGKMPLKDSIVVYTSYKDNTYLDPKVIEKIEEMRLKEPDKYQHTYLGQYRKSLEGAVYAEEIRVLYEAKRVMKVMPIPGKLINTFWDLGKRDHTCIWFAQMQMGEYRILDFYEARGFFLDHYAKELKAKGYSYGTFYLPHDADSERLNAKSIADDLRSMMPGHIVKVIPRMANKALGISAARKIFPNCYFDEEKTKDGLKRLGAFKYEVDEFGGYSTNPDHDENSDAADAFAQLALSLTSDEIIKMKSIMMG